MVEAMLQAGQEIGRGGSARESSPHGEPASQDALIASTRLAALQMRVETTTLVRSKRTVDVFGVSLDKLFANHHCTITKNVPFELILL